MTSGRVWGARFLALAVAIIVPACNNSGGTGTTSALWISNGGAQGPAAAQVFWKDPNTATSNLFVADPYDVRTYTRPDIFDLGNNHPLMTDITAKNFPNIVFSEDRAFTLINEYRYQTFVSILKLPLPPTLHGKLTEHT